MAIPVNFNEIGIKLKLDPASNYETQLKIADTMFEVKKDIDNNILPKNYSGKTIMAYDIDITNLKIAKVTLKNETTYNFLAGSSLKINSIVYIISKNTIKPGVSAIVNEVNEVNEVNDASKKKSYILKTSIAPIKDNTYEIAIKEAMINHTLWTHDNNCTNKIICVASMEMDTNFFVFVVQEKLDRTLMSLTVAPKPEEKILLQYKVLLVLNEIITILKSLWILGTLEFNHCDLKPDNIMIHNEKFKLIDFGISNLKNHKYICQTPGYDDYNGKRNASKDLSALIWYIVNHCNIVFDDNVKQFFEDCLKIENLNLNLDLNADRANWGELLMNVNENDNAKTDITTFVLPQDALIVATTKMSGIEGGNRRKKITRRTNKKLSKKLTKKDRKSKMKGGHSALVLNPPLEATQNVYTTRSSSYLPEVKYMKGLDQNTIDYLSTYSVEHLLTYLRFEKGVIDPAILEKCLKGELKHGLTRPTDLVPIDTRKNTKQMIDLFLTQEKPNDACRLLRVLLQFPIYDNDMTYYNNYITKFKSITDEDIKKSITDEDSYLNVTFPNDTGNKKRIADISIKNSYLNITFPNDKDQIF